MQAPLKGLKVLDMGWLMVGPETARYLGDLGAEVIKLESGTRRDPLRALGPFKDGISGPDRSMSYHAINAGKRSLTVDIKSPEGREVVLRLARWADVLIEAFTPGVLQSLDLSYEVLSEQNPGLIMVSTSILGAYGPESKGTSGTGTTGSAYAGATNLMGWPDRKPMGPHGPWTDSVSPRFIASAVMSALRRRGRTGQGGLIDASQAECGIQFLLPAYFQWAANGSVPQRRGAAGSPLRAPAGIYACAGTDRWLAIDASDDGPWEALRTRVGGALLDSKFDTLIGRLRAREALDAELAAYLRDKDALELEEQFQASGTPAHVLALPSDLAQDGDLVAFGYYQSIDDPEIGQGVTRGPQARLLRTPHVPTRPAPRLGDSTREILAEICGLDPEDIEKLQSAGRLA